MNESQHGQPYTDRQRFEAAQWFMDIHDTEDPSPEVLQRWLHWFEASESNRLAFAAVDRTWHEVPTGAEALRAAAVELDSAADDEHYPGTISVAEWRIRQRSRALRRRPAFLALAVAAAIGVVVLGGALWSLIPHAGAPSNEEFATRIGQHMELMLADGSRVNLGARSRLSVQFTGTARELRLESGEAFFSVRKEARRPFRVHALDGVITAVGTAFNVRATRDRVTVAVTEGVVNVADTRASTAPATQKPPAAQAVRLASGEQLVFTTKDRAPGALADMRLTRVDPAQPARWRQGWLIYQDEPLRDVIADVSRYTDRELSIGESVPRDIRFTGAVFKDSVVEWVEALPEVFPVQVESKGRVVQVNALPVF